MYNRLYQPARQGKKKIKSRRLEVLKALKVQAFKPPSGTCAAVEGQLGGGMELLDEEL